MKFCSRANWVSLVSASIVVSGHFETDTGRTSLATDSNTLTAPSRTVPVNINGTSLNSTVAIAIPAVSYVLCPDGSFSCNTICYPQGSYFDKDKQGNEICCADGAGYSAPGVWVPTTNRPNSAGGRVKPPLVPGQFAPFLSFVRARMTGTLEKDTSVPARGNAETQGKVHAGNSRCRDGFNECGPVCCQQDQLCTEDVDANFSCCLDNGICTRTTTLAGSPTKAPTTAYPASVGSSTKPFAFFRYLYSIMRLARAQTSPLDLGYIDIPDECAGVLVKEWQKCCVKGTLPHYYTTGEHGCCPSDLQGLPATDLEKACPVALGEVNLEPLGDGMTSIAVRNRAPMVASTLSILKGVVAEAQGLVSSKDRKKFPDTPTTLDFNALCPDTGLGREANCQQSNAGASTINSPFCALRPTIAVLSSLISPRKAEETTQGHSTITKTLPQNTTVTKKWLGDMACSGFASGPYTCTAQPNGAAASRFNSPFRALRPALGTLSSIFGPARAGPEYLLPPTNRASKDMEAKPGGIPCASACQIAAAKSIVLRLSTPLAQLRNLIVSLSALTNQATDAVTARGDVPKCIEASNPLVYPCDTTGDSTTTTSTAPPTADTQPPLPPPNSSAPPENTAPPSPSPSQSPSPSDLLLGPASPDEILHSDKDLASFNAAQNVKRPLVARVDAVADDVCHEADGDDCGTTEGKGGSGGKGGRRGGGVVIVTSSGHESGAERVYDVAAAGEVLRTTVPVVIGSLVWKWVRGR